MDEEWHARALLEGLSSMELDALHGLVSGESMRDLAARRSISIEEAADIRESMKWKLGVTRDAEAVRIALIAGP